MDEVTAELEVTALRLPAELKTRVQSSFGAKTDLGRVRENNEDKFEVFLPEDDTLLAVRGQIFIVCDGMGGHAAGQIASELACKTFIDVYLNHPSDDPSLAARAAVGAANRFIYDTGQAIPSRRGMGTTLSGLLLIQDAAYTVQVGDSRVYRLRGDTFEQLTTDHTWIHDALKSGQITPEEAPNHPYRNMISRALGAEPVTEPDVVCYDLQVGDRFIICSDGIDKHVDDPVLHRLVAEFGPSEAAWKIVNEALVNGGSDNATAIVVRVDGMVENQAAAL